MRRPAIFAAATALLVVVTWVTIRNYTASISATSRPVALPSGRVVVAATDLPAGTTIDPTRLRVVDWPAGAMPEGAESDPAKLAGRVVLTGVFANEPVTTKKLASENGGILPQRIPPGMRAVSVPVTKVTGISGFVTPGTHVDVVAIMATPSAEGPADRRAFTLLEDVPVLAVAQSVDQQDTKPNLADTVTLLVTPDDAAKLVLASAEGSLQLALRSYGDKAPSGSTGVSTSEIIGEPKQMAESDTVQVELLRGSDRVVEHF
jgi:pilus assembly protein CpaB